MTEIDPATLKKIISAVKTAMRPTVGGKNIAVVKKVVDEQEAKKIERRRLRNERAKKLRLEKKALLSV